MISPGLCGSHDKVKFIIYGDGDYTCGGWVFYVIIRSQTAGWRRGYIITILQRLRHLIATTTKAPKVGI